MCRVVVWLALALLCSAAKSQETTCKRVDAAFYLDDKMWFFIGNDVYTIDIDSQRSHYSLGDVSPSSTEVTAAIGVEIYDEYYLYNGATEMGYNLIGAPNPYYVLTYTDLDRAFHNENNFHGLDAAVVIGSGDEEAVMAFSGCSSMTTLLNDPVMPIARVANEDIGLPCDVDAALYSPDAGTQIVIKGDAFWAMNPDTGRFDGPADLNAIVFGLEDINFCHYEEE